MDITTARPTVIYGAGNRGRHITQILQRKGYSIIGYIDRNQASPSSIEGIPVYHPSKDAKLAKLVAIQPQIIIAAFNPHASNPDIIQNVREAGFTLIIDFFKIFRLLSPDIGDIYWLSANTGLLEQNKQKIEATRDLLVDDKSKSLFDRIINFRTTLDLHDLPKPEDVVHQYWPPDVPIPRSKVHFIDCGAFDGDSTAALCKYFEEIKGFDCFEPDPTNFAKMVKRLDLQYGAYDIPKRYHMNGISDRRQTLRFHPQGAGGFITTSGELEVECLALDEILPSKIGSTYLKMDIEGGELDALKGCERFIRSNNVSVAICVYHAPSHLWDIPQYLRHIHKEYHFYIRLYGENLFETVLYGIRGRSPSE